MVKLPSLVTSLIEQSTFYETSSHTLFRELGRVNITMSILLIAGLQTMSMHTNPMKLFQTTQLLLCHFTLLTV